jgi:hypothetical protein
MNQDDSKSGDYGDVGIPDDLDVETIVAKIRRDLNGSVTPSMIHEVLNEVIPKYTNARIQTFVPIFIHRDAVKQLRSRQLRGAAPVTTTYGPVEALVAVDLDEEAAADDLAAVALAADTNLKVTEQIAILSAKQERRSVNYASTKKGSPANI